MKIEGINVKFEGLEDVSETEARNYVNYVRERTDEPIKSIVVKQCGDGKVDVDYTLQGEKFERIRRITGYLVGTTDRWNDAKQAEEHERVKHNIFAA